MRERKPRRAATPRSATPKAAIEANLAAMRRKVQVRRKQLGLADEDYRAILQRVAGCNSSTECGPSQLDELLREFRRLGWKPGQPRGETPLSRKAQVRKIYAIWEEMRPLLAVGGKDALRAFVERQTKTPANPTGVSAPEFLDPIGANRVIEGLKAWQARLHRQAASVRVGAGTGGGDAA